MLHVRWAQMKMMDPVQAQIQRTTPTLRKIISVNQPLLQVLD